MTTKRSTRSETLEKIRTEKWKMLRLDRLEREQQLIHRDAVRLMLDTLAGHLRRFAVWCQKHAPPEVFDRLEEVMDQTEAETIKRLTQETHDPYNDH
ncbi:MAG: hypothetical protein CMJ18_00670 [Phycisphaeraceae bacterium]|nr:hypothetical protein [Phycisphaeraceae bacterium]